MRFDTAIVGATLLTADAAAPVIRMAYWAFREIGSRSRVCALKCLPSFRQHA